MADEQTEHEPGGATEQSEHDNEPAGGDADSGQRPFDENPPVDPSEAQVGNSKATFFMPREKDEDDGDEGEDGEES